MDRNPPRGENAPCRPGHVVGFRFNRHDRGKKLVAANSVMDKGAGNDAQVDCHPADWQRHRQAGPRALALIGDGQPPLKTTEAPSVMISGTSRRPATVR